MAIFSEIDGTNICPGLNCEELGATFNQALVFFFFFFFSLYTLTYREGGELGRLTRQ